MRIRAEVIGQMAFDVFELAIQSDEKIDGPRVCLGFFAAVREEMECPYPGESTQRQFEHAGPVDPDEWRIGRHPALELADHALFVRRIAGQPERAPERQPVLMS